MFFNLSLEDRLESSASIEDDDYFVSIRTRTAVSVFKAQDCAWFDVASCTLLRLLARRWEALPFICFNVFCIADCFRLDVFSLIDFNNLCYPSYRPTCIRWILPTSFKWSARWSRMCYLYVLIPVARECSKARFLSSRNSFIWMRSDSNSLAYSHESLLYLEENWNRFAYLVNTDLTSEHLSFPDKISTITSMKGDTCSTDSWSDTCTIPAVPLSQSTHCKRVHCRLSKTPYEFKIL